MGVRDGQSLGNTTPFGSGTNCAQHPSGRSGNWYLTPFLTECGGQIQVVSFVEPPQADVIEAILSHCGLWESRSPRGPPQVHDLVLELDPAYSGNALDAPNEADESQELTYVDIDNFLASF